MSKSSKKMITLGLLVIVLGGLASFYLMGTQEEEAEPEAPVSATQTVRLTEQSEAELIRAAFVSDAHSFTIEASEDEDGRITWIYAGSPEVELEQSAMRNMMRDVFLLSAADTVLETADDPAAYGIGRVVVTGYFRDGSQDVIRLGMMTPDRSRFYVMVDGDPALYLINAISGERLSQGISDLVAREIPLINPTQLRHLYVGERGRPSLEFAWDGTEEELQNYINQFGASWLTMVSPYEGRDLNFTSFETNVLGDFEGFLPGELVELFPASLERFGLDDPVLEFIMEDVGGNRFHLIFGNSHDDEYLYMMHGGRPHVFLAEQRFVERLFGLNPFMFIDRFIALINIVDVDRVTIQSADRGSYEIIINNFEDDNERSQIAPVVNGQEVADDVMRRVYQVMISLFYDQEIDMQTHIGEPAITLTYHMLDANEPPVILEIFPFDSNFYAIRRYPNPLQFVTSRMSVDNIFSSIEDMLSGE